MGPRYPHGPRPPLASTEPLRGANIGCADVLGCADVIGCAGSPFHPARGPSAPPDPRVIAMERGDEKFAPLQRSAEGVGG